MNYKIKLEGPINRSKEDDEKVINDLKKHCSSLACPTINSFYMHF